MYVAEMCEYAMGTVNNSRHPGLNVLDRKADNDQNVGEFMMKSRQRKL
jgi:hypothetical protein